LILGGKISLIEKERMMVWWVSARIMV